MPALLMAPSSTKNKELQRDPEMHQTKKGNQWHFGMEAHIGVDAKSGLTHSLVTTAANERDLIAAWWGGICLSRCRLARGAPARRAG